MGNHGDELKKSRHDHIAYKSYLMLFIYLFYQFMHSAVRNDRNKKRKPKQEGCVSSQLSEELTSEEENMIAEIVSAHSVTLNSVCEDELAKVSTEHLQ